MALTACGQTFPHASLHAAVQGLAVGFVLLRVEALTEEGKL